METKKAEAGKGEKYHGGRGGEEKVEILGIRKEKKRKGMNMLIHLFPPDFLLLSLFCSFFFLILYLSDLLLLLPPPPPRFPFERQILRS